MNGNTARSYPHKVELGNDTFELRYMAPGDDAAVAAFADALPAHDLLFMRRDITQPKVISAWLGGIADGSITTLLATRNGRVCGCTALIRDELSWSPHVGEMRLVLDPGVRGRGLGRALADECFAIALGLGIEKIVAYMTVDQQAAIAVFEELGFRPEAMLREHVRDRQGTKHDVAILSQDVNRLLARLATFGLPAPG